MSEHTETENQETENQETENTETDDTETEPSREEVVKVVSDIAHQLATPLSILMARASAMADNSETEGLKRQINHMTRLVSQISAYTRAGSLTLQSNMQFDLVDLVREVVANQAPHAVAMGKKLSCIDGGKKREVFGDFSSAVEALSNLVHNGIFHTPPGTMVTVSVQPDCSVLVQDRGSGVPESEREIIFERMRQGRNPTEGGAGIGLAIVEDVMKAHGGSVTYHDRAGGGSVFSLFFRAVDAVGHRPDAKIENLSPVTGALALTESNFETVSQI